MALPNSSFEGFQLAGLARKLSSSTSPSPNTLPVQSSILQSEETSIPQNIDQIQTRNYSQPSSHPMITRSKSGIFKPKVYTVTLANKEPSTVQEALSSQNWHQAMVDEYEALIKNETWSLVPFSNAYKVVANKWVFRFKQNTDGSIAKHKARLVAKGFQQTEGVDYFETFSPVVKASTPEGFIDQQKPNHICNLKKALYGLKQAPRAWYDKLKNCLIANWKFQNSKDDTSLFFKEVQGSMILILIYVDDILITGPDNEVSYAEDCIHLSQKKYILDLLSKADMQNCKGCDTPIVTGTKLQKEVKGCLGQYIEDATSYRSLVGGLQYLVLTRPEIAFVVHKLSQYVTAPTLQHVMACKRVLRYLKKTADHGMKFSADGEMKITGFTNADWACDVDDRKSIGAYCIYFGNNLISWSSKKQAVVTRSSAESEYRALASASAEITWIQSLFSELNIKCTSLPTIWCDNISATELANNPVYHSRTKHIELDMHFIRDKVLAKELEINYIPSEEQIADALTKPLTFIHFNYFRDKLNVQQCPLSLRGAVKEAHNAWKDAAHV
ncbi:retrovirus-related pol polyprotein from transposon RE1 [Citrus sinensis]|uniref:Retrovirus-related pol polyprotein from transposon RE1 n=1 Tax=Citrus sinensis TaxID=2711 RepID=A0ACB8I0X3_CITSI|nr:retrovirus-related pol polyprotein from transposon RE1 [Citrus sinensis]